MLRNDKLNAPTICQRVENKFERNEDKMHIFKSLLCITALVVLANTAPAFDFGVDVLEGIDDDAHAPNRPD